MDFADPENVKWRMASRAASDETEEALARAVAVCNRPTWVKIWYESGHTIAEGHVLEIRHRQLDTLLLEQENSCHGLQASLSVI